MAGRSGLRWIIIVFLVVVIAKDLGIEQVCLVGVENNAYDFITANGLDQRFYMFPAGNAIANNQNNAINMPG